MELKLSQKISGRKAAALLLPIVMMLMGTGDVRTQTAPLQPNAERNLDIEFQPDYKSLLPGYREKTVEMVEGNSAENSEDAVLAEGEEADISFFTKIFSDRTLINILLVSLGFVILIIYRLRSGKIRR